MAQQATPPTQGQTPPSASTLFPMLLGKFGLNGALRILALLDPNSSNVSKGFAGGNLASSAATGLGSLADIPWLASLGKGLGTGLGVAATGYDISQIASDSNLSTTQKAGHSAADLANLIASIYVPYYGLGLAARGANQALERSGSPQISGAARGASVAAQPVEGLLSVLQGDKSPGAVFKGWGKSFNRNPALATVGTLDPVSGSILGALGIGEQKPTTGTDFRTGLDKIFGNVGLPQFNRADKNTYNIDPAKWSGLDPKAQAAATLLGGYFGSYAPGYSKNPDAYTSQAASILGNQYGNNVTQMAQGLFKKLNLTPAEAMSRFQSLKLPAPLLNRLSQSNTALFG